MDECIITSEFRGGWRLIFSHFFPRLCIIHFVFNIFENSIYNVWLLSLYLSEGGFTKHYVQIKVHCNLK